MILSEVVVRKDELNKYYENVSDRYWLTLDLDTKIEVVREVSPQESVHQSKGGRNCLRGTCSLSKKHEWNRVWFTTVNLARKILSVKL